MRFDWNMFIVAMIAMPVIFCFGLRWLKVQVKGFWAEALMVYSLSLNVALALQFLVVAEVVTNHAFVVITSILFGIAMIITYESSGKMKKRTT